MPAPTSAPTSAPTHVTRQLERRCRDVIEAELARLVRRAPNLAAGDLASIEHAARDMVERLVLAPVARHPQYAAEVAALFDLEPDQDGYPALRQV